MSKEVMVLFSAGFTPRQPGDFLLSLVRLWSGFCCAHVAVSDGEVVYDPSMIRGDMLIDVNTYIAKYPDLKWCMILEVPLTPKFPEPVGPMRFYSRVRTRWLRRCLNHPAVMLVRAVWRPAMRWLTFGFTRSDDCVQRVSRVLASAGRRPPEHLVTPAALFDWLRQEGATLANLDPILGRELRDRAAGSDPEVPVVDRGEGR